MNTSETDIIISYRADDSYISIVESFLNNQLSVDEVDRMFRKGNLGQQVFIKSQKAFDSLVFTDYEEVNPVLAGKYGDADTCARREVHKFLTSRMRAIQIESFSPFGITAREAVKEDFYYDKDYCCYLPVEEQNNQITKKGKNNYEMEF
ncbi:MAG: DUF3990 domain-containing protein [Ruminococcus sp.]|nr:DUF3990 domain-containing protein [Ruminococcus sp.]